MSDKNRKSLAQNLAKMFKEQTEAELRTHEGLIFVREDYYRLPNDKKAKLKEDMAAFDAIMERLGVMHLGIGKVVNYDIGIGAEPGFHLELTPKQWIVAMNLWDETQETQDA